MTVPAQREAGAKRVGRRAPLIGGIAAVVVGVLLGVLINVREHGLPFRIDEEWAQEMVEIRGPVGDWLALVMNALGGGVIGVFVVPVVVAVLLLLARRPWGALYFILASAVSAGVVQLLKRIFGRPRPDEILDHLGLRFIPLGAYGERRDDRRRARRHRAAGVGLGARRRLHRAHGGEPHVPRRALAERHDRRHARRRRGRPALWAVLAYPLERERLAWDERRADRRAIRTSA